MNHPLVPTPDHPDGPRRRRRRSFGSIRNSDTPGVSCTGCWRPRLISNRGRRLVDASTSSGIRCRLPPPEMVSRVGVKEQVRYGGKRLAPDLTLPQLRSRWAGNETQESRAVALAMWRGEAPAAGG